MTSSKQRSVWISCTGPPWERPCDARDWQSRDMTWIHKLPQWHGQGHLIVLNFQVSAIFNELITPVYLMPKDCHEAQSVSKASRVFRWPVNLSCSMQTFIRGYDRATPLLCGWILEFNVSHADILYISVASPGRGGSSLCQDPCKWVWTFRNLTSFRR